jgi:hypothetical protein
MSETKFFVTERTESDGTMRIFEKSANGPLRELVAADGRLAWFSHAEHVLHPCQAPVLSHQPPAPVPKPASTTITLTRPAFTRQQATVPAAGPQFGSAWASALASSPRAE